MGEFMIQITPDRSPWWKVCNQCGGHNQQLDPWAFWRESRWLRCRDCSYTFTAGATRNNVRFNLRLGWISRLLEPHQSWCGRCHTTWAFVEGHTTRYRDGRGCFPLCEKCWIDLATPTARMPFYRTLFAKWQRDGRNDVTWEEIESAVQAERGGVETP